jgi:hypothetical protein
MDVLIIARGLQVLVSAALATSNVQSFWENKPKILRQR